MRREEDSSGVGEGQRAKARSLQRSSVKLGFSCPSFLTSRKVLTTVCETRLSFLHYTCPVETV